MEPTPIQEQTLPAAIKGRRDIVGAAETGSGETTSHLHLTHFRYLSFLSVFQGHILVIFGLKLTPQKV